MDIKIIIGVAIVLFIIVAIGGGAAYFFWISTRVRKMTWKAKVYQLGDGVVKTASGDLCDLKPFTQDVVEKVDKKSGATHYWLQRLKKAVPVVTADCVEVWGDKSKWVHVLLEGDTTTLLKKGYNKNLGQDIFRPMPHDRINMIKTEIEERTARIENTKDVLAQITPFIVTGMAMLALVVIIYFSVQGAIKIAEINGDGMEKVAEQVGGLRVDLLEARGCIIGVDPDIKKEEPPTIPP